MILYLSLSVANATAQPGIVQEENDSIKLPPKILAKVEAVNKIKFPAEEQKGSTFFHYGELVRAGFKKDSIAAGEHLLEVTPYYPMFLGYTSETLKEFLARFSLTNSAKKVYKRKFEEAYSTVSTPTCEKLRGYVLNIRGLIHVLDSVPAKYKDGVEWEIKLADSAAQVFLRGYIQKNGWPPIEDGSLYAGYIAGRDVAFYYEYLKAAEEAFKSGYLPLSQARKIDGNKKYFIDCLKIMEKEEYYYAKFDISTFIEYRDFGFLRSQNLTDEILQNIKENCPPRDLMMVHYTNKSFSDISHWEKGRFSANVFFDRQDAACSSFHNEPNGRSVRHYYLPNNNYKKDKEFFYVIYRDKR